jgi:hypothetical protein
MSISKINILFVLFIFTSCNITKKTWYQIQDSPTGVQEILETSEQYKEDKYLANKFGLDNFIEYIKISNKKLSIYLVSRYLAIKSEYKITFSKSQKCYVIERDPQNIILTNKKFTIGDSKPFQFMVITHYQGPQDTKDIEFKIDSLNRIILNNFKIPQNLISYDINKIEGKKIDEKIKNKLVIEHCCLYELLYGNYYSSYKRVNIYDAERLFNY